MKLRIRLDEKAPFVFAVAVILSASVALAYAEDNRIAQSGSDEARLLPVVIVLGGGGLAILVFAAFYALWRAQQKAERTSAEQKLVLARSRDRLRAIFDNAAEGICGLNRQGEIVFSNPAAARILGTVAEDLAGTEFASLLENRDRFVAGAKGKARTGVGILTGKGGTRDIEFSVTAMHDHSGGESGSVVMFRDVTERNTAEKELRAANAELEEFAYRTSHDLRSPLVSAIALLAIVEARIGAGELDIARKSVDMVRTSLQSLERLVADILLVSEAKKADETCCPIDIQTVVTGVLDSLGHLDGFAGIAIHRHFAPDTAIESHPRRIELIVANLLSNAIKYRDPERDDQQIWVSTRREGNAIVLVVEDNGLGIPAEQRKNLFAMFKRFHPRVAFGSGLGLYLVKKSADFVGAQVEYSPSRRGTRFCVTFPTVSQTLPKAA